jgi:glucuronate isomerase
MLGTEIEQGILPRNLDLVGNMVRDICYRNAERYFAFPPVGERARLVTTNI